MIIMTIVMDTMCLLIYHTKNSQRRLSMLAEISVLHSLHLLIQDKFIAAKFTDPSDFYYIDPG